MWCDTATCGWRESQLWQRFSDADFGTRAYTSRWLEGKHGRVLRGLPLGSRLAVSVSDWWSQTQLARCRMKHSGSCLRQEMLQLRLVIDLHAKLYYYMTLRCRCCPCRCVALDILARCRIWPSGQTAGRSEALDVLARCRIWPSGQTAGRSGVPAGRLTYRALSSWAGRHVRTPTVPAAGP